jgi:hypothetical protein
MSSDMQVYFDSMQIQALRHLKMEDFFSRYHATYTQPTFLMAARGNQSCFLISQPSARKPQWIQKYVRDPEHIVRLEMLYPTMGDIWYLRLILRKRPVIDWEDALSWPPKGQSGSTIYPSHQAAALKAGYLTGELFDEAIDCFDEALIYNTPPQLRRLVATLTLQGFVTGNIIHDPIRKLRLLEDYMKDNRMNVAQAFRQFLKDLKKLLATEMKTLEDFGLHINPETGEPYQLDGITELQENKEMFPVLDQQNLYNSLDNQFPNNTEQQAAFDGIISAVQTAKSTNTQQYICVHGAGGTGKTILASKVAAYFRAQGELVAISAATTLAATNYPHGNTLHYLIGYPVLEDDEDHDGDNLVQCELQTEKYAQRLEYLNAVCILFIDEVFNLDRRVIEEAIRALSQNQSLVVIVIGDTRQILPVIEHGTAEDIIGATLTSSPIWAKFKTFFLVENKRLSQLANAITDFSSAEDRSFAKGQAEYANMILRIGNGEFNNADETTISLMQKVDGPQKINIIALPNMAYYHKDEEDAAIDWLHPEVVTSTDSQTGKQTRKRTSLQDLAQLKDRAILATKNERVDYWNQRIQKLNTNPAHELKSHDYFTDVDDPHGHLSSILTEDVLNAYSNTQVPNHIMFLKNGDVCLVMRPMKASGVASNTRVRIEEIKSRLIKARTLDDADQIVYIPRMRFKFCLKYTSSFSMTRVQFPLKLCYAMTINKSQGQSFQQVLIDFSDDAFSHGHTYVSLSRARYFNKVRIIVRDDNIAHLPTRNTETGELDLRPRPVPVLVNTVYPSVIQKPTV